MSDGKTPTNLDPTRTELPAEQGARQIIQVDVERYQAFLDDGDLRDDQKHQFVEALWQIMMSFVELGFGVHPVQIACGQDQEDGLETGAAILSPDMLVGSEFNEKAGAAASVPVTEGNEHD